MQRSALVSSAANCSTVVDSDKVVGSLPRAGYGLGLSAAWSSSGQVDPSLAAAVTSADRAGMAGIWVPENVLAPRGALDPLVLLGWVSAITETSAIGTAVLLLPYQHPYRLAQRLASLDALSAGRLIVGVGAGARGTARSLLAGDSYDPTTDYEMDIALLRGLLRGETVHADRHGWPADGIRLEPPPVRPGGPPLWMGGGAGPALDRVARIGDGWVASGSIGLAGFARQHRHLQESIEQTGRNRDDLTVAKRVYLCLDQNAGSASRTMEEWFGETWGNPGLASVAGVSGSPDHCAAEIHALRSAGADLLILDPVASVATQTERIVEELLPLL